MSAPLNRSSVFSSLYKTMKNLIPSRKGSTGEGRVESLSSTAESLRVNVFSNTVAARPEVGPYQNPSFGTGVRTFGNVKRKSGRVVGTSRSRIVESAGRES